MLDAFEGLLEGGNGRGHINVKADGAAVPVICRAGESVLRLNDLCAVEDFSVDFCGELLLNQEGQLNNVSIGFGLVLGPVADVVLAWIVENEVKLDTLGREGLVDCFEERCLAGFILADQDRDIAVDFDRRGILDGFVFEYLRLC